LIKFLLAVAVVIAALVIVMRLKSAVSMVPQVNKISLTPTEFSVRATGWSEAELAMILAHFAEAYKLPPETFRTVAEPRGAFRIEATRSIELHRLLFLINYLRYPIGFDPTGRVAGATAEVTLSAATGAPGKLVGRKATIYVPANDTEFDLVYMRVEPATYFEVSFADMQWTEVDDAREPDEVSLLRRTSEADER
jgi:hypothetical protein